MYIQGDPSRLILNALKPVFMESTNFKKVVADKKSLKWVEGKTHFLNQRHFKDLNKKKLLNIGQH